MASGSMLPNGIGSTSSVVTPGNAQRADDYRSITLT
jgi:hypothetical protein